MTSDGPRPRLVLYSGPLSLFSAKARIALGEKGLEHQLIQVAWNRKTAYAPHHPDVQKLNPKAQVPVLVDGDVVVYDSTLIFEYLEERAPAPPLLPADRAGRARCRQLEAAADEIWFPHVWKLVEARVYRTGSEEAAAEAKRALHDLYRDFDAALDGRDYPCGAFTCADIGCFVFVNAAASLGAPIPAELRRMTAWRDRVAARPAVALVIGEMTRYAAGALAG